MSRDPGLWPSDPGYLLCLADSCCSIRSQLDPGQEAAFRLILKCPEGCTGIWDGAVLGEQPSGKREAWGWISALLCQPGFSFL